MSSTYQEEAWHRLCYQTTFNHTRKQITQQTESEKKKWVTQIVLLEPVFKHRKRPCSLILHCLPGRVASLLSKSTNVKVFSSAFFLSLTESEGFPGGARGKEPTCQCRMLMQKMHFGSLGQGDPLEEGIAADSSILAWRIPWTEEPGGLQKELDKTKVTQHVRQLGLKIKLTKINRRKT